RSSSPTTSTPEIPTTLILPAPYAIITPSSEFSLASVIAPPEIHQRRAILIRPEEDIPIALRYTSHHLDHFTSGSSSSHSSLDHSSSGHSIMGHYGCSRPSLQLESAPLLPLTTDNIRANNGDSSPLVSSRVDLLPPRKRFKDSISPEDITDKDIDTNVLEGIKADAMAVKVVVDRDVEAEIDALIEVRVDVVAGIDIPDGMLTPDAVEHLEQVKKGLRDIYDHEALAAYEATRAANDLEAENQSQNSSDDDNGNGGNGNPPKNNRDARPVVRECTYQDFMKCQPLNFKGTKGFVGLISALTWWNSHKRTIGTGAAFDMSWRELMKLMAKGNVIAAGPTRLQDVVRIANNLMDQKLKGYAVKNAENKRRLEVNQRDNVDSSHHSNGQMLEVKMWQEPIRLATMRENRKMDCCLSVTSRGQVVNQRVVTSFEYERQGHYRSDCPKLKDQNYGNKAGNKNRIGEARGKAYVLGGGDVNPDSNVAKGTFLLNNHYAFVLFDSGVDQSFVSTTFSNLLDVTPDTLDVSYAVELADERISKTNTVLRGCTLGLLGHLFNIDLMPVELGSFDVIIGMDWLANHHAVIVYDEKIMRIPYGDEVLIVKGDRGGKGEKSKLSIISCTKTQKYIKRGCPIFLAQITKKETEDKLEEKRLEDVPTIIMANVNHDDEVPVVEPNQHNDVPVVPEPVLEDEDEDPMEIDIEEDENEPELTCPYEETNSLNPPPPASESEPDDDIEVKNPIEHDDETVSVSVYEVGESFTSAIPREDGDRLLPGFMRRDIDSLFGQMVNFSRRLCGRETAYALAEKKRTDSMERLVEKLSNVKEKAECKKLNKELEEAKVSNTHLRMQNERVERDLYWTRVRAHEFYQEMIRKGFVFEESPNKAIDVPIEDVKSSSPKEIMPPKSTPMTQAAMQRMIKESVDAAIAVERERQAKVRNDASRSGPVRGQNTAPVVYECTFARFMKCNPTVFCGIEGAIELQRWFEKTESVFGISECAKGKKVRIMPPKSAPITQAAMQRMIKESVDEAITVERERQVKVRNDASGSRPVRGQNTAPVVRECTFARFMKCNPTVFCGIEGAIELQRWFEKTESVFGISECAKGKKTEMKQLMTAEFCLIEEIQRLENELWNLKVKEYDIVAYTQRFNELALMCPRMVEPERVKVDAYIRGLTDNIKGEVTSSKPANLSEAVRMAHKLMEQKSQARNERILEGKKRKWENHQGGNSSGKGNQKDNSRQTLQNNQKQGNARAMVTAPTDGK
ncbi:reverse transcriptase domain-containing protein, partial [Tanacetum coccineum]